MSDQPPGLFGIPATFVCDDCGWERERPNVIWAARSMSRHGRRDHGKDGYRLVSITADLGQSGDREGGSDG